MSIVQFLNRKAYKDSKPIQLIFKKSQDFKIPVGYKTMDVFLVGGGGSSCDSYSETVYNSGSMSGYRYGTNMYPVGGPGGYCHTVNNIKIIPKETLKFEVGEGGKDGCLYQTNYNSNNNYTTNGNGLGRGGDSYINRGSTTIAHAMGGGGFFNSNAVVGGTNDFSSFAYYPRCTIGGGGNTSPIVMLNYYYNVLTREVSEYSNNKSYLDYKRDETLGYNRPVNYRKNTKPTESPQTKQYFTYNGKDYPLYGYNNYYYYGQSTTLFNKPNGKKFGGAGGPGLRLGSSVGGTTDNKGNHSGGLTFGQFESGTYHLYGGENGGEGASYVFAYGFTKSERDYYVLRPIINRDLPKENTGGGGGGGLFMTYRAYVSGHIGMQKYASAMPGASGIIYARLWPTERRKELTDAEWDKVSHEVINGEIQK